MTKSNLQTLVIFGVLCVLMAATRSHHFGDALRLPDASLAIFFIAGFGLSAAWAFPALLLEAAVIDWLTTSVGGVSDYCLSPAYAFLIPTYACLWYGGRWTARRHRLDWHTLLPLVTSLLITTSLAYLISSGSFYLLSENVSGTRWIDYATSAARYYPPYVMGALLYVGIAVLVTVIWITSRPAHPTTPIR